MPPATVAAIGMNECCYDPAAHGDPPSIWHLSLSGPALTVMTSTSSTLSLIQSQDEEERRQPIP